MSEPNALSLDRFVSRVITDTLDHLPTTWWTGLVVFGAWAFALGLLLCASCLGPLVVLVLPVVLVVLGSVHAAAMSWVYRRVARERGLTPAPLRYGAVAVLGLYWMVLLPVSFFVLPAIALDAAFGLAVPAILVHGAGIEAFQQSLERFRRDPPTYLAVAGLDFGVAALLASVPVVGWVLAAPISAGLNLSAYEGEAGG